MSADVFPTLAGLAWNVRRTALWQTNVQTAVSGKETRAAFWSYPLYRWELVYEFLRGDPVRAEFQALMGFFNARQGRFDPFLYRDADDNQVAGQPIGIGDGVTDTYQLVRALGGYVEPILAPDEVTAVSVGGVALDPAAWSVAGWDSDTPGRLTLAAPPAAGAAIIADFSFFFPCRFEEDELTFDKFMKALWGAESVPFRSLK